MHMNQKLQRIMREARIRDERQRVLDAEEAERKRAKYAAEHSKRVAQYKQLLLERDYIYRRVAQYYERPGASRCAKPFFALLGKFTEKELELDPTEQQFTHIDALVEAVNALSDLGFEGWVHGYFPKEVIVGWERFDPEPEAQAP